MSEHLFKLKKDGKTVGYLAIFNGNIFHQHQDKGRPSGGYFPVMHGGYPAFDAAYPFVTKDKNGKDVFKDDKVKSWYPCGKLIADDLIVKQSHPCISNGYNSANINNIELIEDKDGE